MSERSHSRERSHGDGRHRRSHGEQAVRSRAFVVGVDFGTLSGRAVVVRVSDGAGARYGDPRLPARGPRAGAAGRHPARTRLGAPGAGRLRRRAPRSRSPPPSRHAGIDPADVDRDRHRLHRLHDGPDDRRRHPAERARRLRRPTRTPTSSSGSTTPPSRRPTGSTRWPRKRGEAWLARYGGLISSEWEFAKGLQLLEEAPETYAGHRALGRGGRLDHLAALRDATSATPAPPATRASTRTAPTRPATSWPSSTPTSPTSSPTSSSRRSASSAPVAGRLTDEAAALDRAARGHRGRGRQRRRPRDRTGGAVPSSPARWSRSWAPRPATS